MFPNAKYLLMIRDGRASVHSMITRKVTISGFNLNDYKQCLGKWNQAIENMYNQCMEVGESKYVEVVVFVVFVVVVILLLILILKVLFLNTIE